MNASNLSLGIHEVEMSRLSVLGSEWNLDRVLETNGCGDGCAVNKHGLRPIEVYAAYIHFKELSSSRQRQWILDYIHTHSECSEDAAACHITYLISGKGVCFKVWLTSLDLSASRFYEIRSLYIKGIVTIERSFKKDLPPKSKRAIEWMRGYFDLIGDYMPDRGIINLPQCLSRNLVYELLVEELREKGTTVSLPQFYKIWDDQFTHVHIPPVS